MLNSAKIIPALQRKCAISEKISLGPLHKFSSPAGLSFSFLNALRFLQVIDATAKSRSFVSSHLSSIERRVKNRKTTLTFKMGVNVNLS